MIQKRTEKLTHYTKGGEGAGGGGVVAENDEHYLYLQSMLPNLDPSDKEISGVRNVIGYCDALRIAIKQDDLVVMRRHEIAERYTSSFKRAADGVRALTLKPTESGQQNIFGLLLEVEQ